MTAFCHINSKPACIFCINVFMQGWFEFIFVAFILRLCLCFSVRLPARWQDAKFVLFSKMLQTVPGGTWKRLTTQRYQLTGIGSLPNGFCERNRYIKLVVPQFPHFLTMEPLILRAAAGIYLMPNLAPCLVGHKSQTVTASYPRKH